MSVTAISLERALFESEFDSGAAAHALRANGPFLRLAVPWLGGMRTERLFPDAREIGAKRGFRLWEADGLLLGAAVRPAGSFLRESARDVYQRLFEATAGAPLYRIWNYVPAINATTAGLENYRAFCQGRSEAFEAVYGSGCKQAMPSASAVGCGGDELALVFVAGRSAPRHIENPEQVPAYEYPAEHGPRPPSFSRATLGVTGSGRQLLFVSGTAAIKGHATIAPQRTLAQLDCTLDNLRLVSASARLGNTLGADGAFERHFKVYVRKAVDYRAVRDRLEAEFLRVDDRVVYLNADICRADLSVEIEATLIAR